MAVGVRTGLCWVSTGVYFLLAEFKGGADEESLFLCSACSWLARRRPPKKGRRRVQAKNTVSPDVEFFVQVSQRFELSMRLKNGIDFEQEVGSGFHVKRKSAALWMLLGRGFYRTLPSIMWSKQGQNSMIILGSYWDEAPHSIFECWEIATRFAALCAWFACVCALTSLSSCCWGSLAGVIKLFFRPLDIQTFSCSSALSLCPFFCFSSVVQTFG